MIPWPVDDGQDPSEIRTLRIAIRRHTSAKSNLEFHAIRSGRTAAIA
jgi:hypothetical protein